MTDGIVRAREELAAAQLLSGNGFAAQAVSRAFHAAFYAAEAALLLIGEARSEHSEVVSVFVRRVVRERSLDRDVGRLLRSLFNRGRLADHSSEPVPAVEATAAVHDATAVVDAVAAWMDEPVRTVTGPQARRKAGPPAKPVRRRR